ncbi:hypothetical protein [Streptomyces sp. NPDC052107]|uniref:hypothetical protein n=1 Tax=Streptomyces sp. NPDC052107 TaxID=3155632 RepID=UPI0034289991
MGHRIRSHIAMGASAETYNLLHPAPAREPGGRKAKAVPANRAEVMMTANTVCRTQVASPVRKSLERALYGPGAVVARAIPRTTTVPTRGAAPSSPVS